MPKAKAREEETQVGLHCVIPREKQRAESKKKLHS